MLRGLYEKNLEDEDIQKDKMMAVLKNFMLSKIE